ncbi:hypothetical protein MYOV065v1_p0059 [Vibrio phage PS15B.2]|nr:hypothetical protein MYOV065v1_p0059 [Vibrio phage PS15B.2]QZI90910.1 hypothetical protein MYOV064v1_p0060 [Vibrio phage PS15B.4]
MLIEEYDGKKFHVVPVGEDEMFLPCDKCDLNGLCDMSSKADPYPCIDEQRDDSQDVYFVEVKNV